MNSSTEYLLQIYSSNTQEWISFLTVKSKTQAQANIKRRQKDWPFFKLRIVRRVTTERVMT